MVWGNPEVLWRFFAFHSIQANAIQQHHLSQHRHQLDARCYCSRVAQTATDFADASHSKSAKSVTTTVSYGIFSSENAYLCTVTYFSCTARYVKNSQLPDSPDNSSLFSDFPSQSRHFSQTPCPRSPHSHILHIRYPIKRI